MPQQAVADPTQYLSHIQAARATHDLFEPFYEPVAPGEKTVADLRRHRRRATNDTDTVVKTVSLVEENGTLYWRDGVPGGPTPRQRRARRRGELPPRGSLVLTKTFPALAPNKVIQAMGELDCRLNKAIDKPSLGAHLRQLRRTAAGTFELSGPPDGAPFSGRTLLFVHGTFSNAENMLGEFTMPGGPGQRLLNRAMSGADKYDRVLFFEHATLSVSPVINALELERAFAGASGQIDVVAHSRGGLVVRWWLEAFGSSLSAAPNARVRAVLAGSPLHGTSLAAPDKIQHAMSLLSNIGTFAEKTLSLVGAANPFIWVAGKLIEVVVSVAGGLARAPVVDALSALVPGLCGQSAVDNNHEINRLRIGPAAVQPSYYAVMSNFETENPGWRFWRNFRKDRVFDVATDVVFPSNNDLVVDTWSMTDFGVPKLTLAGKACDFGTSDTVWHCNYFRQPKTIDYIADAFEIDLK